MTYENDGESQQKSEKRGYKHPPKEHRFKAGQKPPPRKKKAPTAPIDTVQLFWRVLQEPRKATVNGSEGWYRADELVVRKAFAVAEQGNSTLNRLLNQLLLADSATEDEPPVYLLEPNHPESGSVTFHIPADMEYVDGRVVKRTGL